MRLTVRWPDDAPGAKRAGALDYGGDGDRLTGRDRPGHVTELRVPLLTDRLDEDIDDPAARQAHAEGCVVTDAVPLEHRLAARDHVASQLVDRPLDAPARNAAHHFSASRDGERCTRFSRRAAERPDHSGQTEGLIGIPPFDDLVEDVSHAQSPA